jgi:hypothetical protein
MSGGTQDLRDACTSVVRRTTAFWGDVHLWSDCPLVQLYCELIPRGRNDLWKMLDSEWLSCEVVKALRFPNACHLRLFFRRV